MKPAPWKILLTLGRVSNLPTVWSNALAGVLLAGATLDARIVPLAIAMSAYYVAGMFLNDYFDRDFDKRARADRPIPAGWIAPSTVAAIGSALLVAGFVGVVWLGGFKAAASGIALAAAIVLYDAWHKDNALGPLIMGMCRVLVYLTCALAMSGQWTPSLLGGALALLCHLIGLTYLAKHEATGRVGRPWPLALLAVPAAYALIVGRWSATSLPLIAALGGAIYLSLLLLRKRAIPKAVALLIAAISLLDGLLIAAFAGTGSHWAWVAAAGCPATLLLHRRISGT